MARYCYVNEKNPLYEMRKKYSVPTQYNFIVKIELCILSVVILLFASTFFPAFSNAKSNQLAQVPNTSQKQVLGATTPLRPENNRTSEWQAEITPTQPLPTQTPSPIPTIIPSPTPTPIPEKPHAKNEVYVSNNGSINDKFCFLDYPIIS